MEALLAFAILAVAASLVAQMLSHARWSRWAAEQEQRTQAAEMLATEQARELARLWLAHRRVVDKVYGPERPRRPLLPPPPAHQPFELDRRADWSDDRLATRRMTGHETFLPVDFQHDLW
jgi:hypothetical protein